MKIGSLFSGYGGLDMAAQAAFPNAHPAWFVEYDQAPASILKHHWPEVPNYGDITTIDWDTIPQVDILTGRYPCQPFSHAGTRKGEHDERHLWPHVREAIRHLRPRYIFLENVAGHRSLGFDRVLGDMAEDGLHAWWTSIRASDIGAPHHRERLFILAAFPDSESLRRDHGQAPHTRTPDRKIHTPHHDCDPAPTPRAADHQATMGSAGAHRHVEKGNGSLAETVGVKMLPTPTASDARRADSVTDRARNTPPLTVVTEYFPDLIGESMGQRSEGGKG